MSNNFYKSREWRELRYKILRKLEFKCGACGAKANDKILHVDHIKPRSKYPELELSENNLQVLCEDCNLGKSNIFEDDFVAISSPKEESNKKQLVQILKDFEKFKSLKNLTSIESARLYSHCENELRRQYLREQSRKLSKKLRDSGESDLIELLSETYTSWLVALTNSNTDPDNVP